MIEWNKRAKRSETSAADRRTWNSKCGHYQVVEVDIKYGRKSDNRGNFLGYPVYYLAMFCDEGVWQILSEHRKRNTAVKQCEHFHEKGCLMPKQTKAVKAQRRTKAKRLARREAKTDES